MQSNIDYKIKKYQAKLEQYTKLKQMQGGAAPKFKIGDTVITKDNNLGTIDNINYTLTVTNVQSLVQNNLYKNAHDINIGDRIRIKESGGGNLGRTTWKVQNKIFESYIVKFENDFMVITEDRLQPATRQSWSTAYFHQTDSNDHALRMMGQTHPSYDDDDDDVPGPFNIPPTTDRNVQNARQFFR